MKIQIKRYNIIFDCLLFLRILSSCPCLCSSLMCNMWRSFNDRVKEKWWRVQTETEYLRNCMYFVSIVWFYCSFERTFVFRAHFTILFITIRLNNYNTFINIIPWKKEGKKNYFRPKHVLQRKCYRLLRVVIFSELKINK